MRPGNDKNVIGLKINGHYGTKKSSYGKLTGPDNDKWKLTSDNSPIKKVNFDNYLLSDYRICAQHWWQTPILRSLVVAHGGRTVDADCHGGLRRTHGGRRGTVC